MTPGLPQFDPRPDQRAAMVALDRTEFQLSWDYADLPVIENVPAAERFTPRYTALAALWEGRSYANIACGELKALHNDPAGGLRARLAQRKQALLLRLRVQLDAPPADRERKPWNQRTPLSIADYESLVPKNYIPESMRRWRSDWYFAWQRVAGCNPVLLERVVDRIPPLVDPDPAIFGKLFDGDTPEAALAEGRLFQVDLAALKPIASGSSIRGWRKWLYPPVALFVLHKRNRRLMPVCIRCDQVADDRTPLFYPTDGIAWMMARTVYQVAESNYHGVVQHGVYCHLMIGAVAVCMYRNLAPDHPLRILLHQHFRYTLPIDQLTLNLFKPGGRTPVIQSPDLEASGDLARWAYKTHHWNEHFPPTLFDSRGVGGWDDLPDYPFRDDGVPQWHAIRRFVGRYVQLYYKSDGDVGDDTELQDWIRSLLARDGARLRGIGVDDQVLTMKALTDLVAQIIWRVSTYHAVINYGVWPAMGFMPNMPMAQYAPAPSRKEGYELDDLLAMFPPRLMVFHQFDDVFVVGHLRANQLGRYPPDTFCDRRVRPLVQDLQAELDQQEFDIHEKNDRRPVAFDLLLPSNVTASIHI